MALAPGLLGAHEGGRPGHPGTLAEILVLECQAEVGDVRLPGSIHQDVGGLDVSMDQAARMSVVQGLGDRRHQIRRLVQGGARSPDPAGQVAPLDVLGYHETPPVVGAPHVVNRDDVGMVEIGEDAGFVQVLLDILGPRDPLLEGHLDGDGSIKLIIKPQEDLTEPALP